MTFEDPWVNARCVLWSNIEPEVNLIGITVPGYSAPDYRGDPYFYAGDWFTPDEIEGLVTRAATVSTGVDVKEQKGLIKNLIKLNHGTPLEFVTYQFVISGISKSCSSQISRHRMASIVSASRRYQEQGAAFVYPILESVKNSYLVVETYNRLEDSYRSAYETYMKLKSLGVKKGDCRYVIPVASATEKAWSINARSLRNFFQLRLHNSAESEIRRLAQMILDQVMQITPTLFEDIKRELDTQ